MPKTILIADDERYIVHILALKIRQAGFVVLTASNGEEAYELACREKPNLVVTDYQMPRLDGFDLALKLANCEETRNTPVIMLTARGHRLDTAELGKTRIQCLLAKPFSAHELLARIQETLDGESLNDDTEQRVA